MCCLLLNKCTNITTTETKTTETTTIPTSTINTYTQHGQQQFTILLLEILASQCPLFEFKEFSRQPLVVSIYVFTVVFIKLLLLLLVFRFFLFFVFFLLIILVFVLNPAEKIKRNYDCLILFMVYISSDT